IRFHPGPPFALLLALAATLPDAHLDAPHHANFRAFDLTCHPRRQSSITPVLPPALPEENPPPRSTRFSLNPTNEQIPNPVSPTTYPWRNIALGQKRQSPTLPAETQEEAASCTLILNVLETPLARLGSKAQTNVFYTTHALLLFLSSPALHPCGLDSVNSQLNTSIPLPAHPLSVPISFDITCCAE
ncbi:hypothetical protein CCMA1212_001292, partial [Trichoderma ghanense]